VTVTVEANFDTGAFFGFPGAGTPAPSAVRCSVSLEGPEPPERYEELAAAVDEHCPVLHLFSAPVPVERTVTTA
jgi:organic hydroperoxide reductase OsmC/OhrA